MQPSSVTRRWLYWPCAAGLSLALATPAFANGGGDDGDTRDRRTVTKKDQPFERTNPCNGGQITGTWDQETTTRDEQKRDGSSEFRQRVVSQGKGVEDISLVEYKVLEDDRVNARSKRQITVIKTHLKQKGDPLRPVVATPASKLAVGFFFFEETETVTSPTWSFQRKFKQETECRDKNGDGREDDHDD